METSTLTLGARIKAAREARGLTQGAFAEALGLTGNTVRKIERDERVAPPTLRAAVDFLHLDDEPDDLASRVDLLERRLDVAIAAIHLLTTSAKPTSDWLDATLAGLAQERHA